MVKTTKQAIDDFKAFVKKHPKLAKVKRENELSWQDLFEEWVLYGEDESFWKEYGIELKLDSNKEKKLFNFGKGSGTDLSKLLGFLNQIDPDDLQEKLKNVDNALTTISGFIGSFTSSGNSSSSNSASAPNQSYQGPMNGPMNNPMNGPMFGPMNGNAPNFGPGPNYTYYNRD